MKFIALFAAALAYSPLVFAFPALGRVDSRRPKGDPNCYPYPNRPFKVAEPYSKRFPYLGAAGSQVKGSGKGNILVPAKGDHAHAFHPPPPGSYRGPCPGLNVAANHGFLSPDGVSSFDELVEMMQNLWNFGYDTAVALATVGIAFDGDMANKMLSIGANASCTGQLPGGGLNLHDTFEVDASLTRNDYYLSPTGDDYSLNVTLWTNFVKLGQKMQNTKKPVFNKELVAAYKSVRGDQSSAENGQFHRGPNALLPFGAAGLMFEAFGGSGLPTYDTIMDIHGVQEDGKGGYIATLNERLPKNWRNRATPWTLKEVGQTIHYMYTSHRKELGHNDGLGNWVADEIQIPQNATASEILCFLYDATTNRGRGPSPLPHETLKFLTDHLNPHFVAQGCEILEVE